MNEYEKLKINQVSEISEYLINTLKYEIYSKLPRLSEEEKEKRQELSGKNKIIDFKELDIFYKKIREKYSLFLELKYIPNELLHELYGNLITFEIEKFNLKNNYFFYSTFIKKTVEKTVDESFDKSLEERMERIGSSALKNFEEYWVSAIFDSNTSDSNVGSVNDIIKYNAELSNSRSLIIIMELYYDRLIQDIYTLLTHKKFLSRIIFKIEQKSFWISNNVMPMIYFDDDEWDRDVNRIINVLLNCLIERGNIMSLSLLADEKCKVRLNDENVKLLCEFMNKNKNSLEVLTISRFAIQENAAEYLWDSIIDSLQLKILIFKGARFTDRFLEKIKSDYSKGKTNITNNIYFRFSKKCMCNKNDDE